MLVNLQELVQWGVKVSGSLADVLKDCDVIIDFTAPAATAQHLKLCREAGVAMVIGTTGMSDEQKAELMKQQRIHLLYMLRTTLLA